MIRRENIHITGTTEIFPDRATAGKRLTHHIQSLLNTSEEPHTSSNTVVLGVPRGGVIVAAEVAQALNLPLDLVVTRKLRAPNQENLVIGAVTERGKVFLNKPVVDALAISDELVQSEINHEHQLIQEAVSAYRTVLPATKLANKTIILIDDNVMTGATMFATLRGLWAERPQQIILAVPVGPNETLSVLSNFADHIITLKALPGPFGHMSDHYDDTSGAEKEDVLALLQTVVATPFP